LSSRHVDVPWSNKELEIKWEHFTSKLEPSQKETWTAVITKPGKDSSNPAGAVAELVATLYDASLDQYLRHSWLGRFGFFRHDYSNRNGDFANVLKGFQGLHGEWRALYTTVDWRYRE